MGAHNTHYPEQFANGTRRNQLSSDHESFTDEVLQATPPALSHLSAQGSCNAPRRAEAMHSMQRTHGNRAVQRSVRSQASTRMLPVQREEEEEKSYWEQIKDPLGLGNDGVGGVVSPWTFLADKKIGINWRPAIATGGRSSFLGKVGKASNVLGIGLGLEKAATAQDGHDVFEGMADSTFSAIGLTNNPHAQALSTGYSVGRLLDQGVGMIGGELSETEFGRDYLGMRRLSENEKNSKYTLSGMLAEGAYGLETWQHRQGQKIAKMLGFKNELAYDPETDEPTKIDRSYETTAAYQINEFFEGETWSNFKDDYVHRNVEDLSEAYRYGKQDVTELYHDVHDTVTDTYHDVKDDAVETYHDVREGISDTYEGAKETYHDVKEQVSDTYNDVADEVSDTYSDVKEGASEVYNDASEYAEEKIEAIKEYIPDIEMPKIETNPLKWF